MILNCRCDRRYLTQVHFSGDGTIDTPNGGQSTAICNETEDNYHQPGALSIPELALESRLDAAHLSPQRRKIP